MGISESIKEGHDEYRRFLLNCSRPLPKMPNCGNRLFIDLQRKLYAHQEGEELKILPRLTKIPDLNDLALELEVEHAHMNIHFEALMREGYELRDWASQTSPAVRRHTCSLAQGGETMIPFGPEYLSESEGEDLGKKFDEIVDEYL